MTIGKMTMFDPGVSCTGRVHPEYVALPSHPQFQGATATPDIWENILVIGFCQEDT